MNKILIIVLIIIVLVGGYFAFFNKSNAPVLNENQVTPTTNTTTNNPTVNGAPVAPGSKMETGTINTAKGVMVNYTNSGFSPKTVTIKKGEVVTFVNQSSGDMWVASNPHPIHTDYPAFDEKVAVGSGSSWSFTFDQVGIWGYHNHKSPSNTGTIVVQ